MSLYNGKVSYEKKLKAVETYSSSGQSLRKIAKKMRIPHTTLQSWVKLYKAGGVDSLKKKKVWRKRIPRDIELRVAYLKEQNPSMTIRSAQRACSQQGIMLSGKGIWQIWKRYGLTKRSLDFPIDPFIAATPEVDNALMKAENLLGSGKVKEAATIINALPCISSTPLIKKIPDRLLSSRRKLDYYLLDYGTISVEKFGKRMRQVAQQLEEDGRLYSSIIANFWEVNALEWMRKPNEIILVLDGVRKKLSQTRNRALWFYYYTALAKAHCELLHINDTLKCVTKIRRLAYRLPISNYYEHFAALLSFLGRYKEAHNFYKKALQNEREPADAERHVLMVALMGHAVAGEYSECERMLKKAENMKQSSHYTSFLLPFYCLCRAYISYGKGDLTQAFDYFLEALDKTSARDLLGAIYSVSLGLATVSMALNKRTDAKIYLKKYFPMIKKRGSLHAILTFNKLLGSQEQISGELLRMPDMRILHLIARASETQKIGDYKRAFNCARKERQLGFFQRLIVFFPASVNHLLEKGKQTGLPRTVLKFPVFNQNIRVYHVRFLGDVIILKQNKYSRIKLTPKEKALLIHLALRAGAPGKSLPVNDLCTNFWVHSTHPFQRLSHLLSSLKRKLAIPTHMLGIASPHGEQLLNNRNIYFTTDYGEFETLQTEIKTLERADQWSFARRDYLRAFKLLRSEPFRKMYDPWSEQMRAVILGKVNETLKNFVQGCISHDNRKDAQRIATRLSAILPISEEVQNLAKDMVH